MDELTQARNYAKQLERGLNRHISLCDYQQEHIRQLEQSLAETQRQRDEAFEQLAAAEGE